MRRWISAATVGLLATSCGAPVALPPGPAVVNVVMRDYRFDYNHAIPSGQVVFRVHNEGHSSHDMVVVALPDDFPPIATAFQTKLVRAVSTLATLSAVSPGAENSMAVQLSLGRYGIISFQYGDDGVQDAHRGMESEFRVT